MDNGNKWSVERYSRWKNKNWEETPLTKGECVIMIKDSQLLLINKDTTLESVCLAGGAGFVKSSYSVDNLGILVQKQGTISKFRIKFDKSLTQTSINQCISCVKELKKYIQVSEPASSKLATSGEADMKFETLNDVVIRILHGDSATLDSSSLFPDEFPLEEFVRQCILDPGLSSFVNKVEKTLRKIKGQRNK